MHPANALPSLLQPASVQSCRQTADLRADNTYVTAGLVFVNCTVWKTQNDSAINGVVAWRLEGVLLLSVKAVTHELSAGACYFRLHTTVYL